MATLDPAKIPLLAGATNSPVNMWTLWRKIGNEQVTHIVFLLKGDLITAMERAQAHCKKMRHKFVKVEPFCVDLDEIEKSAEQRELIRTYGKAGIPDKPKKGYKDPLDEPVKEITK